MGAEEKHVDQVLADYKNAIEWAKSLIPDIKPTCRIYQYLELLEATVRANAQGTIVSKPTLLILDALHHSNFLIGIHKKFHNRRDEVFLQKLRASLMGPVFSNKEELGEGFSKGSKARDLESELILAAQIRNPEVVSFEGNDVVYDLKDYKFGAEVKRIHSLENIEHQFLKGCKQLVKNSAAKYGMVTFRFDKHFFLENGTRIELIVRAARKV